MVFLWLFPKGMAQSGFSVLHGDSEGTSYTFGQPFYRQYYSEIFVSEGVEQGYLLQDTVVDDGCAGVGYDNFGVVYGDTVGAGLHLSRQYMYSVRDGYDSIFVHILRIHPVTVEYDTLLLAEDELGSYSVGESVDSLHSSYGCDSVVFRMVYAVSCPADYLAIAPYGVSSMPYPSDGLVVTPDSDGLYISSDAPPLLTVGTSDQVTWLLATENDTFRCVQNVRADFPPCGDGFTAVDGDSNVYETVRVGADCWMRGNVKAVHYAGTGDTIPVSDIFYADVFPDTASNLQHYGRLYSWYSAVGLPEGDVGYPPSNADGEVQGVCPKGWHIPTLTEMSVLQSYDAPELKATGDLWIGETPNDASHLSIVPGGLYNADLNRFESLKAYAYLWSVDEESSSAASAGYLPYVCGDFEFISLGKINGCSVRCIKD